MVIALCCDKGSPGVTTSALALASAWPEPAIVVEADPAGGDLGIRLRPGGSALPEAPTVLSLAASARADKDPSLAARHAQRLNANVSVVPGALRREQMAKVGDWSPVADALARSHVAVLADVGELHATSPMLPIAAKADLVLAVGRPDMSSVIRLRDRLAHLGTELGAVRGAPPRLFPLLVSTTQHGPAHTSDLRLLIAETAAQPFLAGVGFLALDEPAVRRLEAGGDPPGRLARTNLMRTARSVVDDVTAVLLSSTHAGAEKLLGGVR